MHLNLSGLAEENKFIYANISLICTGSGGAGSRMLACGPVGRTLACGAGETGLDPGRGKFFMENAAAA